jgi:hypothetical protein
MQIVITALFLLKNFVPVILLDIIDMINNRTRVLKTRYKPNRFKYFILHYQKIGRNGICNCRHSKFFTTFSTPPVCVFPLPDRLDNLYYLRILNKKVLNSSLRKDTHQYIDSFFAVALNYFCAL